MSNTSKNAMLCRDPTAHEDKTLGQRWWILHSFSISVCLQSKLMNIREYLSVVSVDADAWTNWWMDGNWDSYIEQCYMTKAEQMREKVCNFLAPENESSQDVSEVLLTIVRVALRLDWEPAVPVPRLLVPLKHYYGLASACDTANRRQKKINLLRATITCILEIDTWLQQLQDKAPTRSKIMTIEKSPIMNSLIQFFVFVFKQMPKKQLEYLFYTVVRRFSIFGAGVQSLVLTGLLGGMRGHNAFQNYWGMLAPAAHPRSYAYVLLVVSANKCHIHMCIFFTFTSINESISSDHYHFHVDRSTKREWNLYACALTLSLSARYDVRLWKPLLARFLIK